jgi:hypothetical protein
VGRTHPQWCLQTTRYRISSPFSSLSSLVSLLKIELWFTRFFSILRVFVCFIFRSSFSLLSVVNWMFLKDLPLAPNAPGGMILYRKTLTTCFFFKYFLWVRNQLGFEVPANWVNVLEPISRPLSSGTQVWTNKT